MYVYKILRLLLAYDCIYKLNNFIYNKNSLDHILLIVHPTIILPTYTDKMGLSYPTTCVYRFTFDKEDS